MSIALIFFATCVWAYCIFNIPGVLFWLLPAIFFIAAYSFPLWKTRQSLRLNAVGFSKTLLLAVSWTYITFFVPLFDYLIAIEQILPLCLVRFTFMLILCMIFDARDVKEDKLKGLSTLATSLTKFQFRFLLFALLALHGLFGFFYFEIYAFSFLAIAFVINWAILLFVSLFSLRRRSYYFYYFVVDGMMLLSTITTFLASII